LRLKILRAIHKHAIIASNLRPRGAYGPEGACSYSVMCHFAFLIAHCALRICHLVVQIIETARSRLESRSHGRIIQLSSVFLKSAIRNP